MQSDPDGGSYTHTAFNKVKTAALNTNTEAYLYGTDGFRVRKVGSDGVEHYFVRGANGGVLAEYIKSGQDLIPSKEYIYLGDAVLASMDLGDVTAASLSVALATPTAGQTFSANQAISFEATPAIPQGMSGVRVEYYQGGQKIGQATSAPYTWSWSPPGPGTYSLKARVVTSDNHAVTSPAVTITVLP